MMGETGQEQGRCLQAPRLSPEPRQWGPESQALHQGLGWGWGWGLLFYLFGGTRPGLWDQGNLLVVPTGDSVPRGSDEPQEHQGRDRVGSAPPRLPLRTCITVDVSTVLGAGLTFTPHPLQFLSLSG